MAEPFLGEIRMMGFSFAPRGWAHCDGQSLPVSQNQALYSLLGNQFGGNHTTFNLPDLRGRAPVHQDKNQPLGSQGGESAHTLTVNELPSHRHKVVVASGEKSNDPRNQYIGQADDYYYAGDTPGGGTMDSSTVSAEGSGQPHDNMQPYSVVPFCIALQGIYPTRD
ncbi:microcystin-dependent protein [Natronospira proteinivora]|uniref:Microcystin-dependent protein n=1 Tax=Natronospira proteinivora TaxID=1807133 RepID=A0ABT1GE74_9GAMM|nr:tail fiber protein [Natronospira proteinivora]MCP1728643.1 microcystin-dependent protein [Natronospira proteinivora]